MNTQSMNDLADFHRFVSAIVQNGETALTPEQVLDEWRILRPDPLAVEDDLAAIQEAVDDIENGDLGIPVDDFDRDFRARHNLPPKS